ncbi:ArsR/SmtB family transcription factor [Nostoc commune]|uniref:ArsR/SmtB family transcription factor n=1 Tax=Nostoc commune TaxID=1178 RepID=UPI0018C51FB6|nr:metalloregulator ArsR/SmtB family transcription factor [Nostoc commune]MBG1260704.1 helix-turn-helix transcriptional regulator [Nostoc commune BAE]
MNSLEINKEEVIEFLTAVGDPTRLEIMFLLGNHEKLTVNEITSNFQLSRPAISHHLKVLKEAKIADSEKVGQEIYYWIDWNYVLRGLNGLVITIERCPIALQQQQ